MRNVLFVPFVFLWVNIFAQKAIHTADTLTIGGIRQYITIKTKDDTKPLFLFLHGGPGGSVMGYADKFTAKLQEHFIVVQWDQRETGKTLALNPSPEPLSFSLFQKDTRELIDTLLRRFSRQKLYLAGHSWGTAIGFQIAGQYPQLLHAYLAISPMVNQVESEKIILKMMNEQAQKGADKIQLEELAKVNIPFVDGEDLYYHRKWLFHFAGQKVRSFTRQVAMTWSTTWLSVFNEASKVNLMESLRSFQCPVYIFVGRKDYQTNYSITENYYTGLTAPKKNLFWFENTGHAIPYSRSDRLQEIIINNVLPEIATGK